MRVNAANPTEDPVRRQQSERTVQCVRVGSAPRGQLVDAHRFVLNLIGHPKLRNHAQASARNHGRAQRPDDLRRSLHANNQIPGSRPVRSMSSPIAVRQA